MIRLAAMIAAGILIFCATLIGAAYFSGNLTQDDFRALFGEAPEPVEEIETKRDDLGPTARMLLDREEDLDERAAALDEREKRLLQREAELSDLKAQIEGMQAEVVAAMDGADAEQEAEIAEIATSLESMDAMRAAETLGNLLRTKPAVAVKVVKLIPKRQRGKILNEMQPEESAALFQETLEPAY
jgi:flagellar motility protein MotE (MotC chaperone)